MNQHQSLSNPHGSSSSISTSNPLITLESLPPELQIDVLAFLNPVELVKACKTCKKLREVGLSDKLWKDFIEEALSSTPILSSTEREPPDQLPKSSPNDPLSVQTPNGTAFFSGAYSHYEIYLFIRLYADLLGFWQGDLPYYGKMIRITFVPKSSTNVNGPSFICQEVKLTNRLIEAKWETWRELTSFELGRSIVTGIGGGTQLERWNELLKVDLCFPKMIFSDLWRVDWKDFVEKKLRNSTNEMNQREAIMLWKKRSHDQAFSSSSSNDPSSSQDTLNLKLERVDLYKGTEQEFEDWRSPTEHGSLPSRFPTPSALPAFSSVECISCSTSSLTDQVTPSSYTHQALTAGTRIKIDRLTFTPDPPPYYQSDREAEVHEAYHDKPLSFFPLKPLPRKGLRVLPDWSEQDKSFDHRPPAPELDPSHPNFDWKKLEGLYGVSYGPHGVELIYVRTRFLTDEDFDHSRSQEEEEDVVRPAWWPEPSLREPDMYSAMAISKASVKPGVRVLEGVKISGDPHVPRGTITFRAFLDDPSCVSIPWRAPPPSVKNHLPFPHRTDEKTSNASILNRTSSTDPALTALAPGYMAPAHGRIAEFGFTQPAWFPAQIHISTPDEIRLWWYNMGCVMDAKRLTV